VRLAVALSALLLALAPSAAQAATASVEAGALRIVVAPGEYNAIDVGPGAAGLLVSDTGAPLTLGPGCIPQGIEALCTGATRVEADLADGDDVLTLSAPLPADLTGGDGNDALTVIGAVATLDGGAGDDTLTGGTGADLVSGGDGFDTLTGGEGNDRIDGGTGGDSADGGGGNDSIVLRDKVADTATCGSGRDTVRAEVLDQLDFACERVDYGPPGSVGRLRPIIGGGRFVPIPGQSWARVDRRILRDVLYLIRRYHVQVGDGYATTGHERFGEHPLGLAVDLYPGPGGSWRQVARLAKWAEPRQNRTRPPFRWVGWNGDANHGDPQHCKVRRGCPPHLHLSWSHSPGKPGRPVRKVWVFDVRSAP
jgi:RTX calcium-binding nonapeptide repeat (4 copies)